MSYPPQGIDPYVLYKNLLDRYVVIPIYMGYGNWNYDYWGSGWPDMLVSHLYVHTGRSRNSGALLLMRFPDPFEDRWTMDWRKNFELWFTFMRRGSDQECQALIQLKEEYEYGPLTTRGVGIVINNLNLVGESYESSKGTVSLGTIEEGKPVRMRIVKLSGRVEFWVNGLLAGTLTGNVVPNTLGEYDSYILIYIKNGSTGGVDDELYVSNLVFIQEITSI